MSDEELLKELYKAWNDPGKHPAYHRQKKDDLRRQWPRLGQMLDRLVG
jgi:hypothetical protein